MAIRSIASLSPTFGLVSIPVKIYLAIESSAAIKFKLAATGGARLRQQYVDDAAPVDFRVGGAEEPDEPAASEQAITAGATTSPFPANRARDAGPGVEGDGLEPQVGTRFMSRLNFHPD